MTKSQYQILSEELEIILLPINEEEKRQVLLQIALFLSESNLFGDDEELEEPDERHPVAILQGQLFPLDDKRELAKWCAILALYLAIEIEKRNKEDDLRLVNYALHALNSSKSYSAQADIQSKQLDKGISQYKSEIGTKANLKGKEPLNRLKKAAFEKYEPAIKKLQARKEIGKRKTNENRATYQNVAEIVYPEIAHLNELNGRPILIGRNGYPVDALARIFKEAAIEGRLKPTRGR